MGIDMPSVQGTFKTSPYTCRTFSSTFVKAVDLDAQIAGDVPEIAEVKVVVERRENEYDLAVCIPSKPLEVIILEDDWDLRRWWEEWRHNIAVSVGPPTSSHVGPIFLVLEKTDTDQFSNCYYQGKDTGTNLKILGRLVDVAKLAFEAGYSCTEIGGFDFKSSPIQPNGQKWSIFIRSEKLRCVRWSKFKYLAVQAWQFVNIL